VIFAGIDVNIITHEKALAAGVEAFGLWSWGMCYAQLHTTDGRLPRVAVLSALMGKRNIMVAKKLVEVGLWFANDDGSWTIWNYGKKNQTAEEIQKKRDDARARKEAWKARQNAFGTRPGTRSEQVPERQPEPEPSPPPENTTTTRHQGGERARAEGRGSRVLRSDEALTDQRRKDFESLTASLPARDIDPEWRMFVDDRIAKSVLFASASAVDADWRKWVTRENVIQAKARVREQNDNSRKRGAEITKQPYDPDAPWMKLETGS
jgi:hypothetical protein